MPTGSLESLKDRFNRVGWFIPPYRQLGFLFGIANDIDKKGAQFQQSDLEGMLSVTYNSANLAAMVSSRYPVVPVIKDYGQTISEAIEAHFLGLNHVATGGLIPVIEGAGRQLAAQRGIMNGSIKAVFKALAIDCKAESAAKSLGAVDEVASMLESFIEFTNTYFYSQSHSYPLLDNTNRHGIAHGAYADTEYGSPLNFYKTISSVDFLVFISSFRANISWLAPNPTDESAKLTLYYEQLKAIRRMKPA
jgi:hypothetical protein